MSQPQGMRYPGSKLAAGCREQIIGAMPPHDVYVEPYLGGGAIFYAKRAAAVSIVNDADADDADESVHTRHAGVGGVGLRGARFVRRAR